MIDRLSPILNTNIEAMNRVYGVSWTKDSEEGTHRESEQRLNDVYKKLGEIDESYNKAIAMKVVERSYQLK